MLVFFHCFLVYGTARVFLPRRLGSPSFGASLQSFFDEQSHDLVEARLDSGHFFETFLFGQDFRVQFFADSISEHDFMSFFHALRSVANVVDGNKRSDLGSKAPKFDLGEIARMTEPATPIRYALLLDTETSGLNPEKDVTIEVAVTLFDVKFAQPVASYASLISGDRNEARDVNGIPPEMLPEAYEEEVVWRAVRWLGSRAQVIIAHHAEFDRKFCPDLGKNWICSEEDIQWPGSQKGGRGGSLSQLALRLGLGVSSAHRASVDVDTLSRILTRLAKEGNDLQAMLVYAMRPKGEFHSLAPFEQKDVVKGEGFRWDPDKKIWWRRMAIEDAAKLPFRARMVGQ